MGTNGFFEVWFMRGTELVLGPKFRTRQEADGYIALHAIDTKLTLKTPDGEWIRCSPPSAALKQASR